MQIIVDWWYALGPSTWLALVVYIVEHHGALAQVLHPAAIWMACHKKKAQCNISQYCHHTASLLCLRRRWGD